MVVARAPRQSEIGSFGAAFHLLLQGNSRRMFRTTIWSARIGQPLQIASRRAATADVPRVYM